jgi:hypothetical protein
MAHKNLKYHVAGAAGFMATDLSAAEVIKHEMDAATHIHD